MRAYRHTSTPAIGRRYTNASLVKNLNTPHIIKFGISGTAEAVIGQNHKDDSASTGVNHRGVADGPALDSDQTYTETDPGKDKHYDPLRKTQKIGSLRETK